MWLLFLLLHLMTVIFICVFHLRLQYNCINTNVKISYNCVLFNVEYYYDFWSNYAHQLTITFLSIIHQRKIFFFAIFNCKYSVFMIMISL